MSHKSLRSPLLKSTDRWSHEAQIRNMAQIQSPLGSKKFEAASFPAELGPTKNSSQGIKQAIDSSETADGMIGLRRLLRKENTPIPTSTVPKNEDKFGVKKSSSGIIGNSYWARISANQPSFLRKFFEKKSPSTPIPVPVTEKRPEAESEVEPFVALNVAEKASHFMKLEHEQRFSKWRTNGNKKDDRSKSNRYSTQPVTTLEVQTAAKIRIDTPNLIPSESSSGSGDVPMASQLQLGTKSSSSEFDDVSIQSPLEPSSLSLKDRVHMFNRLSRLSISSPPQTPLMSSSRRESRTGKPDVIIRRPPSKSEIESSYEDLTLVLPLVPKIGVGTSLGKSTSSPIPFVRKARVQSMYVQAMDSKSEDETSSGGQEVAEIISRSYENSPIVRKKSWRSLKSTPAAPSKDIKFRKWDDNISHWSTATDFSMRMDANNEHSSFPKLQVTLPVVRSLPTTTSNLLPILTALSSSDDQLSESKPAKVTPQNFRRVPRPESSEVRVPNPDNESFRTFFKNELLPTFPASPMRPAEESPTTPLKDSSESDLNLGWVERDGELLVNLKRQLPRRKSSGKSRNPLKVLAARIDFKNQKYTETLQ